MDASLVSLGVALVAVITALVGALTLARQRPRAVRAAQVRHPAATPPMSISLTRDGRDAHWQVGVRASAPPTSIDILSYRAAGSGGQWENEPIVTPIRLEPGEATVLSNVVVGRSPTYDVVVAWTEHRPDGDRTGSGTFTVHETGPAVATPPSRHRGWIVVAAAIAVLLVVAASLIVAEMVEQTGDDTTDPAALSTTSSGAAAVTTTSPTVTSPTVTTPPAAPETSPPATTAASTTAPTPGPTTAPTPVPPTVPTTAPTGPDGPVVVAIGRIEECRFGTDCLVAGFTIEAFETPPTEYVCEFADGERVTFSFLGDGAETACSARSAAPSITVEVAGVRSNTLTPDDLGPVDQPG